MQADLDIHVNLKYIKKNFMDGTWKTHSLGKQGPFLNVCTCPMWKCFQEIMVIKINVVRIITLYSLSSSFVFIPSFSFP
jgi:hypothetical protein